jgi:CDP-4-dehydro-6-deoxyglucose reductase, E3
MSFRVSIQPSNHAFNVPAGDTVLKAGLAEGFNLPYGCRNGACGSCKGKILEGKVDYGQYTTAVLSEQEKNAGYALFCCAKPLTDLVVEVREIGAAKDIVVKKMPCRVHKIEKVTDDVAILYVKLPANERMQFLAGQYVDFLLKDGLRRSFSMANAPHDDEYMQLHVRHVPGGTFTGHVWNTMKEREILRLEGPLGSFFLRDESTKPIVFVASGTGFAPIKSILEDAFRKGIDRPITLYWGGRRPKDLYLSSLAEQWAREYAQFEYVPVISDALPEDAWTGRTGFVHRAVMADLPDLSEYQVYACGVPIMVDSARADFTRECGLPLDEFFADSFTTTADLLKGEQTA